MKSIIFPLLALLALGSIACSVSRQVASAPMPVMVTLPTETQTSVPVTETATSPLLERCVTAESALWLRSSPEVLDDNKLLALPNGTRILITTGGIWDRVYVPQIDQFGYVRSDYVGDCK